MPTLEPLTLNDVDYEVEKRAADTVLVVTTDSHGRLAGTRVFADSFLRDVVPSGLRMPAHLLCTDATGSLATGYPLSNPATGLRDLRARVDQKSMFRMPWLAGTIGALTDVEFLDGTAVTMAPRTLLRRQVQRLEDASMTPSVGAEVQFTLLDGTDAAAPLPGAGQLVGPASAAEKVLSRARRLLSEVPVRLSATSGLVSAGGYELTLSPSTAMRTCDEVVLVRSALTAIARDEGLRATFMPSYDSGLATALHLSLTVRGTRGTAPFADHYGDGSLSEAGKSFVAGILAHAPEVFLLYAPSVNAYRRFGADVVTPRRLDWGSDNRTCAIRTVDDNGAVRIENRLPGSDANPHLVLAAMIASGLDGYGHQLPLQPQTATGDDAPALPTSLAQAVDLWADSAWVRETFGAEVQEHYTVMGRLEAMAARAGADISWERQRYLDMF